MAIAASLREGAVLVAQPAGLVEQIAGQLDFHAHVRQLEGDGLERGDRPAELDAVVGVFQGRLEGALAPPSPMAAMESRPPSSVESIWWNPSPRLPSKLSFGTTQSSKTSSPVFEARHIIFFFISRAVKPGASRGTMRQLSSGLPLAVRPVTAWTMTTPVSGLAALVMKIFEPLMTQ